MNKDLLHSKVELFETGGEISYQGDANVAKFLLGGIGTGNIAVGARGQLLDWEIFNWPGKGQFVPFSFFAIRTKEEGEEPVSRILESKIKPPFYKSHGFLNGELAGIPRFEKSKMVGKQPFVYVDLEDSKVPVKVRMEAYTPLFRWMQTILVFQQQLLNIKCLTRQINLLMCLLLVQWRM